VAHHRPSQLNDWTFRRVAWATLVLVSVALSFWLLYRFNQVVFILFVAILMGTVIRPAAAFISRMPNPVEQPGQPPRCFGVCGPGFRPQGAASTGVGYN